MHVISKKPFMDASKKYPKYAKAIIQAYDVLRKVECETPEELKKYFSSLDNFKYKDKTLINKKLLRLRRVIYDRYLAKQY